MKHRNHRKHIPALNAEQQATVRRLYFKRKWKQVTIAIQFRVSQSTIARYIANAH